MTPKCCKTCLVNPSCEKEYSSDDLCQDAKNELAYHLYKYWHKRPNILDYYKYAEIYEIFNDESIKYIKNRLKKCRPPKQFRKGTIKRIERKIDQLNRWDYEGIMEQIYGPDNEHLWGEDAPGYRD